MLQDPFKPQEEVGIDLTFLSPTCGPGTSAFKSQVVHLVTICIKPVFKEHIAIGGLVPAFADGIFDESVDIPNHGGRNTLDDIGPLLRIQMTEVAPVGSNQQLGEIPDITITAIEEVVVLDLQHNNITLPDILQTIVQQIADANPFIQTKVHHMTMQGVHDPLGVCAKGHRTASYQDDTWLRRVGNQLQLLVIGTFIGISILGDAP